jgi:cobalt transporter subunit CbtA
MLQRLLITGLMSGTIGGVLLTVVHLIMVQPLIEKAEFYEQAGSMKVGSDSHIHKSGISHSHAGASVPHLHEENFHVHADGIKHVHPQMKKRHSHFEQTAQVEHGSQAHSHGEHTWTPADGIERSLYSLAANVLTAIAFSLLLVSGFTAYAGSISLHQGLLWGLAGFACFSFLPGLGLPPELPASAAGDLLARQIWWLGTAVASVIGLSLFVFCKSVAWRSVGLLLLVIPHVVGAPLPEANEVGVSSPELAAHFVMFALFASAVMWATIGLTTALFYNKSAPEDPKIYSENLAN